MPILSQDYLTLILAFAPVFTKHVWQHVQVLLTGAILAPGKRAVTAVLRVMRLSDDRHFQSYHRVLNRLYLDVLPPGYTLETRRAGVPATGKTVEYGGVNLYTVVNGKIAAARRQARSLKDLLLESSER